MREAVDVNGATVGELLEKLAHEYSPLKKHLFTEDGNLRSFVNVYINDEDIRYLQKEATKVTEKDVVSIVPSIAGGV
jgi:adenylyltransferase/sulfurtransferase